MCLLGLHWRFFFPLSLLFQHFNFDMSQWGFLYIFFWVGFAELLGSMFVLFVFGKFIPNILSFFLTKILNEDKVSVIDFFFQFQEGLV